MIKRNKPYGIFTSLKILEVVLFALFSYGAYWYGYLWDYVIMNDNLCIVGLAPCGWFEYWFIGILLLGCTLGILWFLNSIILKPIIKANWKLAYKIQRINKK